MGDWMRKKIQALTPSDGNPNKSRKNARKVSKDGKKSRDKGFHFEEKPHLQAKLMVSTRGETRLPTQEDERDFFGLLGLHEWPMKGQ